MTNIRLLTPDETEVFYDVANMVSAYRENNGIACDSRSLPSLAKSIAVTFQELHKDTKWDEDGNDYIITVDEYTTEECKKSLISGYSEG